MMTMTNIVDVYDDDDEDDDDGKTRIPFNVHNQIMHTVETERKKRIIGKTKTNKAKKKKIVYVAHGDIDHHHHHHRNRW